MLLRYQSQISKCGKFETFETCLDAGGVPICLSVRFSL
jgi:hypothetical protein